jgi:hypothetical protein
MLRATPSRGRARLAGIRHWLAISDSAADNSHRVTVRWEVQNLTNHPNFSGISTVVNSASYGRVSTAGTMRTMDFNVRVAF